MENAFGQKALTWAMMMLGIGLAYSGHLIVALLLGTLAHVINVSKDIKFFGDEEEPNEGEEL